MWGRLKVIASTICITCQSCWFPDLVTLSCCAGEGCLGPEGSMAAYVRDGHGAFCQAKFECGCCEMLVFRVCGMRQNLCVQSLLQPWPRWLDFWMFTNINGCCAGWECACLFPFCLWFEWPSSGVIGFCNYKWSWCCSVWLHNCVWLQPVGCRPDPCIWWNTWPPDDWCSWPSTGFCCTTHR